MLLALMWGAVAASSLLIGAVAGVARDWNRRLVGLVLGFGAGALVSSIAFELAEEGFRIGGEVWVAVGLALGAIAYYFADIGVNAIGGRAKQSAGSSLALGALLDGIPEQAVLGIGIAGGEGVSLPLLVAIFVSNLPEAIGSATDMRSAHYPTRMIVTLWTATAAVLAGATVAGYALQHFAGNELRGSINGFAAGALLVMLVGSMIPEAQDRAKDQAGLAAVLGFAVAAGLSLTS